VSAAALFNSLASHQMDHRGVVRSRLGIQESQSREARTLQQHQSSPRIQKETHFSLSRHPAACLGTFWTALSWQEGAFQDQPLLPSLPRIGDLGSHHPPAGVQNVPPFETGKRGPPSTRAGALARHVSG